MTLMADMRKVQNRSSDNKEDYGAGTRFGSQANAFRQDEHKFQPRSVSDIPLFTCPKDEWSRAAPVGDIRVVAVDEISVTYTYESCLPRPDAQYCGIKSKDESIQKDPVDHGIIDFSKLEKYAADIDKIIQEPSMKQINGSAQPHKNKINLTPDPFCSMQSFSPPLPPPHQSQQIDQNISIRQNGKQIRSDQLLSHATTANDVQTQISSLQSTVMQMMSLTKQKQIAAEENAALRDPLEKTTHNLNIVENDEIRAMRMLKESQNEIMLLQQMQLESNRLNAALMVQLQTLQERQKGQELLQQATAASSDTMELHNLLHNDWRTQQKFREVSDHEASVAITTAAAAAQKAQKTVAVAAERAAAAAASTAREVARLKVRYRAVVEALAEERELNILVSDLAHEAEIDRVNHSAPLPSDRMTPLSTSMRSNEIDVRPSNVTVARKLSDEIGSPNLQPVQKNQHTEKAMKTQGGKDAKELPVEESLPAVIVNGHSSGEGENQQETPEKE